VICTNWQLAALVKTRPQSLAKPAEIEGFGKAKRDKYDQEMLGILARSLGGGAIRGRRKRDECGPAHAGYGP
jgi:hypothetical protein